MVVFRKSGGAVVQLSPEAIEQVALGVGECSIGSDNNEPTEISPDLITFHPDIWLIERNSATAVKTPYWNAPVYSELILRKPGEYISAEINRGGIFGLSTDPLGYGWYNLVAGWFKSTSSKNRGLSREDFRLTEILGRNLKLRILIEDNNTLTLQSFQSEKWVTHYSVQKILTGNLYVYATGAIAGVEIENISIGKL